jgi:hypothetical protein
MSAPEIQQLADRLGEIHDLSFHDVRTAGASCAFVSGTNRLEVASPRKTKLMSIGSSSKTYQFIRRGQRWEFDLVGIAEV